MILELWDYRRLLETIIDYPIEKRKGVNFSILHRQLIFCGLTKQGKWEDFRMGQSIALDEYTWDKYDNEVFADLLERTVAKGRAYIGGRKFKYITKLMTVERKEKKK